MLIMSSIKALVAVDHKTSSPMNLRAMRKKARISLKALAAELRLRPAQVRDIERFPETAPMWSDRYVEALTRLTA